MIFTCKKVMNVTLLITLSSLVTVQIASAQQSYKFNEPVEESSCLTNSTNAARDISSQEFSTRLEALFSSNNKTEFDQNFFEINPYLKQQRTPQVTQAWSKVGLQKGAKANKKNQAAQEAVRNELRLMMSAVQFTRLFHSPGACRTFVAAEKMSQRDDFNVAPSTQTDLVHYSNLLADTSDQSTFSVVPLDKEFYLEDFNQDGIVFKIKMGPPAPIETAQLASFNPNTNSLNECSGDCVVGFAQSRMIEAVMSFGDDTPIKDFELSFATTLAGAARKALDYSGESMNPGMRMILQEIVRSDNAKEQFLFAQSLTQEQLWILESTSVSPGIMDSFTDVRGSIDFNIKSFVDSRTNGVLPIKSAEISFVGGIMSTQVNSEIIRREESLRPKTEDSAAGLLSVQVVF